MNNVVNQVPYLRTQRNFPEEIHELCIQLDKAYIDTANSINQRTIGLFPTSRPAITGESWFLTSQRRQGFRQVYSFTSTGTIPHGISGFSELTFTKIYGTFTDGTNYYPLPWVDTVNANNQITIYLDSTNIHIVAGAGAPPTISSGNIVLEWISQP